MSKRMMVDIDDTVGNFSKQAASVLDEIKSFTHGETMFRRHGSDLWDISDSDFRQLMLDGYIFEHMEPIKGSVKWINDCFVDEWDIVFCTARGFHPNAEELTMEWLSQCGFAYDNLWVVDRSQDKKKFNSMFDMVIDDNVNAFAEETIMHIDYAECLRYLITQYKRYKIPFNVDGVYEKIDNIDPISIKGETR